MNELQLVVLVACVVIGFSMYRLGHLNGVKQGFAEATRIWQTAYFSTLQCPKCGGYLEKGPRGGACINSTCTRCGKKFNLTPLGIDELEG